MKSKSPRNRQARFETLEGRLTLSAIPGWPTAAAIPPAGQHVSAAHLAKPVTKAPVVNQSSNWSGYAVTGAANSVSYVAGTWTVPTVSTTTSGYSAVWVGIDGYNSSSVEQIGTAEDVVGGRASYYAWYEMYPSASVTITSMAVHPGDSITGSVSYSAGSYVLTLNDTTDSQSFTKTIAASGLSRSSAEWIVEAPSNGYGILPLANFGTTTFTNSYATIAGATGAVDTWQSYAINLASRSKVQATTSTLTDSATGSSSSFKVAYNAPSTVTPTPPTPTPPTPTPPSRHHHGWGGWGGWGWGGWGWNQTNVAVSSALGGIIPQVAAKGAHNALDQFFAAHQSFDLWAFRV
jgi:hypothetical protein